MTSMVMRPMRGLWRDRHPADVPMGALQRAENVVFRRRGVLSPIEAPRTFAEASVYPSTGDVSNVLAINKIVDLGEYALLAYLEGNADVGNLARTDEATIADGTHYHHGTWVVDGRATVDGRVVLITEAIDATSGSPYTIETGDHYHYGRWVIDATVTVNGRVILILDKTEMVWAPDATRVRFALPEEVISYEPGCMNAVVYRDRVYWTSRQGLICVENIGPVSELPDENGGLPNDARRAGLPAPLFDSAGLASTTDASGSITSGNTVNVVVLFKREFDDGSFARSAPCTPVVVSNSSGALRIIQHTVMWTSGIELEVGDLIEAYRTEQVTTGTDPGEDYKYTKSYAITAADIAQGYAEFEDHITDDALGESMYTNPGEDGMQSAHFPPPYMRDVVDYGGAFLGIMARERESITVSVGGGYGSLSTASEREYGIGMRTVSGDTTSGVATITNASSIVGIEAGQLIKSNLFPAGTRVVSAASTTIVTDHPATGNDVGASFQIADVIEVNGITVACSYLYAALIAFAGRTTTAMASLTPCTFDMVPGITMRASVPPAASVATVENIQLSWSRHYAYGESMPFTVGATNGQNYFPPLGSLTSPTESKSYPHENRITWSAGDLPESYPLLNSAFVGSAPLVRLLKVADAVYCFADDGTVYRISGTVGDYRIDPAFYGYRLLSAPAAASFGDIGYFWSSRGWVRFGDGSLDVISRDRVGLDLKDEAVKLVPVVGEWSTSSDTPFNWFASCAIDPVNAEAWLRARVIGGDGVTYVYSEGEQEITEYTLVHGLGCVGYARGCFGGGVLLSGLDSVDIVILSPRDMTEAASGAAGGLYEGTFCIEFQRIDMGAPDGLKLLTDVVVGMTTAGGQAADVSASVTVHGDMDQGDGSADSVALTLPGTAQRFGRAHVVPVGRSSAQSSQYTVRIESEAANHGVRWFLEHVALRFSPASETTGVRS